MTQAVITNAGYALFAQHQNNETALVIDRFLLANVPNLDPTQEPNRDEVRPAPSSVVSEFAVTRSGYVTPNRVVYSLYLDSTIGTFDFNWIGLLASTGELVAVRYVDTIKKIRSELNERGNTLSQNFLISYTDAQAITQLTIDAATWQLQFDRATQTTFGLTKYGDQAGTACEGDDSRLTTDLSVTHYINGVDVFSSTGKKTFINRATSQLAGMMAAEDKGKLNGIQNGAQVNVGTNLSAVRSINSVELRSSTGNNTTIDSATSSAAGVMAASDWQKLNGIEAGAQKNVSQTLSSSRTEDSIEINISSGNSITLYPATPSISGIMSAAGQAKLNGIEPGAQKNIGTNLSASLNPNYVTLQSSTGFNVNIFSASSSNAGVLTADLFNKLSSIEFGAEVNVPTNISIQRTSTVVGIYSSTGADQNIPAATNSLAGVMSASDKSRLDSLDNVPPGAVVAFARSTPPVGWLNCNGANVGRATYADLFASIGIQFGNGDGSTTFTLPDMRGRFARGWTNGSSIDSGRVFGSEQLDAIQNITGSATVVAEVTATSGAFAQTATGNRYSGSSSPGSRIDFNASRVVRTATETRPRNRALLYCIKY